MIEGILALVGEFIAYLVMDCLVAGIGQVWRWWWGDRRRERGAAEK